MAGLAAWRRGRGKKKPGARGPARRPARKRGKATSGRTPRRTAKGAASGPKSASKAKRASAAKRSTAGWRERLSGRRPRPAPASDARRPPLAGLSRWLVMLVAFACMVGFAVLLAKVTLVPSPASVSLVHPNFTPGASIRAYTDQPAVRDTVKQIGGNVLLGLPFGFLLPVVFPRARGLLRVVLVTAFVMLCVETAQGTMVAGRAFDIDDVILNTFGALLGYLVAGRRLSRSVHPRRRHWWQRRPASDTG